MRDWSSAKRLLWEISIVVPLVVVGYERVDGPDEAEPAGKAVIAAVSVVATAVELPVEELQVEAQVQLPALH